MKITDALIHVGVNDYEIDLFEGQYTVENGMAYNSYLLLDEKTAVMDTVDKRFCAAWLENLRTALDGRTPDYLVVHHMEPDHSGSILAFMEAYPAARIVASSKAFVMMAQFFGTDFEDRGLVVGEGDTLALGAHTLTFLAAPMVHWPEVLVSFVPEIGTLFSADGFGKFGALDTDEDWDCEARRYYFGIVGKYGAQVQALLKKAASLPITRICPLHGPVLSENIGYYVEKYNTWSSYAPETEGVFIAYTSVYGGTEKAVLLLKEALLKRGCGRVVVADLAREDWAEAVEDAFRHDRLVLATTTYNADIFPFMKSFLDHLTERNFQNRTVGIIENGSWASVADKKIRAMLENSKNLRILDAGVHIKSAPSKENMAEIEALADALMEK